MTRPTPARVLANRRDNVLPFRSRVVLHGWARADSWSELHYVRGGRMICGGDAPAGQIFLVGALRGRTQCTTCVALQAVPR